jgi:[ribosomal protein S18]-alanine N-acetyltransferase
MMTAIRRGEPQDLAAVAAIQYCSPEAAHWNPEDYLAQDFRVTTVDGCVAGFLVIRFVAPDEGEILNLAIAPEFRRMGFARGLLADALKQFRGSMFLEVRESNRTAQQFYEAVGFKRVGTRYQYYESPLESAIVMKFHSC